MNIFCLSIDGLQNAMLGTYGNAWIQTPALNRLAAQSIVFDRFYANSLDLWEVFDALMFKVQGAEHGVLVTDDSDIFLHPCFAGFQKKHLLEMPQGGEPVSELEETQFFKAAACAADGLRTCGGAAETDSLFWLHLQGFRGIWDFPLRCRERYKDDEDPEPYNGVLPPDISPPFSPDELQAVMEAYSGGITILDDTVAGLLNLLENGGQDDMVFVLMGTRGFSLGEHNRIGVNNSLYGENLHLPLFVRFPNQKYAALRIPQLIQTQDAAGLLYSCLCSDSAADSGQSDTPLFQRIREENVTEIHQRLYFHNTNGEAAVLTPEWFLRKTEGGVPELYAKPDDRFEFNDVADRRQDIMEELTESIENYVDSAL